MRSTAQRVVAIVVMAVLNAAWFFTIGCAALCAFASCPQQRQPTAAESCHHKGQIPTKPDGGDHPKSPCPERGYAAVGIVLPASRDVTPGLQGGGSQRPPLDSWSWHPVAQFVSPCDIFSHSPPGVLTGRAICRKESLLRI